MARRGGRRRHLRRPLAGGGAAAVRSVRVPTTLRGLLQARLDSLEVSERARHRRRGGRRPGVLGPGGGPARHVARRAGPRQRPRPARRARGRLPAARTRPSPAAASSPSGTPSCATSPTRACCARCAGGTTRWPPSGWRRPSPSASAPTSTPPTVAHHHEEAGHPAAGGPLVPAGRRARGQHLRRRRRAAAARPRPVARAEGRARTCGATCCWPGRRCSTGWAAARSSGTTLDELGAEDALDPARKAQVRLAEGRWLFFRGEYPAVPPVAEEAAELARRGGPARPGVRRPDAGRPEPGLRERARPRPRAAGPGRWPRPRQLGDHKRAGEVLRLLAVVATNRGATEEGMRLLDAARDEHRQINDREGEAMVVGQLGALLMNWGRLEEARVASEEALEVFEATGHRYREGVMLTNLARIAMEQGRLDDALEGGRRALRLTEEIDDAEGVVASLQSLGDGYRLAGDHQHGPGVPGAGAGGEPPARAAVLHRPPARLAGRGRPGRRPPRRRGRARRRGPGGRRRRTTSRTPTPAPTCSRAWCGRTSATRPPSTLLRAVAAEARRARRRGRLAGEPLGARPRPARTPATAPGAWTSSR